MDRCKYILLVHIFRYCHLIVSTYVTDKRDTTCASDIAPPTTR